MKKNLVFLLSLISIPQVATAQIVPDTTIVTPSVVNTENQTHTITGGTQSGSNLFHSFEEFSLPTGSEAVFNNAADIVNILSRVTGSNVSDIDGLISAVGDANLFLINPNGIIFGENASLNIGGTFTATTASSVKFADGSEFNAVTPENSILTVSLPTGVQLGGEPGSITVNGTGNNLFFNDFYAPDVTDKPTGLTNSAINLIAGNFNLDGGNITSSQINLAAVTSGEVGFTDNGFNLEQVTSFGDLNLINAASIDAPDQGIINATAKNISLSDGSAIIALSEFDNLPATINLDAKETLTVMGESAIPFPSFISTDNTETSTQLGGTININANHLNIDQGGMISASTNGEGDGGTININASKVDIIGSGNNYSSSIIIDSGDIGKGGLLNINAETVNVVKGAAIASSSYGSSQGGTINLNANLIKVSDFDRVDDFIYSPFIAVGNEGTGKGGVLNIKSDSLTVADSGQITASTNGTGQAGEINIESKNITVTNATKPEDYITGILNTSGLEYTQEQLGDGGNINIKAENLTVNNFAAISTRSLSLGNGGNIDIQSKNVNLNTGLINTVGVNGGDSGNLILNTDNLTVTNGGQISSATVGAGNGNAGNLTINAKQIEVTGTTTEGNSGILSNAIVGSGNAGNIKISTEGLKVTDGGTISVSNFSTRNANKDPGTGKPGTIEINANSIDIRETGGNNPTGINADANAQSGGMININAPGKITIDGSNATISTLTKGAGNGGNINLTTPELNVVNRGSINASATATGNAGAIALQVAEINTNNGQILSESTVSQGGNVQINSNNLLLDNNSLISTSAKNSNSNGGNITINNNDLVSLRNNSNIFANAVEGSGGKIDLATKVLFTDLSSSIDAASQLGIDGSVVIKLPKSEEQLPSGDDNSPLGADGTVVIKPSKLEQQLPSSILPEQIATITPVNTVACPITTQNAFINSNNGNLTQLPKKSQPNTIAIADTLIKSPSGEIELVATDPLASNCQ
ncbi:filamentous hemagglutinin family outer membrane protein [Chondrocystis sp. NIES-4102]|nr:filamentous hemagglutinin family outer membrane protein [Chondrocystis sp. NIES-4102]